MTSDRVLSVVIGQIDARVKATREAATNTVLNHEQYAHHCGQIHGLREAAKIMSKVREQYLEDRLPEGQGL
jgi:hypothetical protein